MSKTVVSPWDGRAVQHPASCRFDGRTYSAGRCSVLAAAARVVAVAVRAGMEHGVTTPEAAPAWLEARGLERLLAPRLLYQAGVGVGLEPADLGNRRWRKWTGASSTLKLRHEQRGSEGRCLLELHWFQDGTGSYGKAFALTDADERLREGAGLCLAALLFREPGVLLDFLAERFDNPALAVLLDRVRKDLAV